MSGLTYNKKFFLTPGQARKLVSIVADHGYRGAARRLQASVSTIEALHTNGGTTKKAADRIGAALDAQEAIG